MKLISCDMTSGLIDLILSPSGSLPFYHRLVPASKDCKSKTELSEKLVDYCYSYGLTRTTANLIVERGFFSLPLLALLPKETIAVKFPDISERQRHLIKVCIASLDPRPEYQISQGLNILAGTSRMTKKLKLDHEEDNDEPSRAEEISSALELASQTKKLLECPVCYQICRPPRIWQCTNGHLTCDSCHNHTTCCPLCRSSFSNIRPFTAEKLAKQVPTPCKNYGSGCNKTLPWREREQHEISCDFAIAHCPVLSCSVQVPIKETMEHMRSVHNISLDSASLKLTQGGMSFRSSISAATYLHGSSDQQNWWWGPQFVVYETIPFFFIISRRVENPDSRGHFFFWLWFGGNQAEAKRFLYTLTVEGVDGEKIAYTAKPVSLELSVNCILEEQSCLLLSDSAVKRMLSATGEKLQYRIEIIDKNTK